MKKKKRTRAIIIFIFGVLLLFTALFLNVYLVAILPMPFKMFGLLASLLGVPAGVMVAMGSDTVLDILYKYIN